MRKLLALSLFIGMVFGTLFSQNSNVNSLAFKDYTVSTLPSASANPKRIFKVTDGVTATDCVTGNGSTVVYCQSNGSSYSAMVQGSMIIGSTFVGAIPASQVLAFLPAPVNYTIPSGCTNSQVLLGTATTANLTITFSKDGTSFGTAVIAAGTTGGPSHTTWTCSSATSFTAGTDYLQITSQNTADTTAATIGVMLYATR